MMRNSFILLIISALLFVSRVRAEVVPQAKLDSQDVSVEHLTEEHIDMKLYKSGGVYELQEPLEVVAGKKGYRDDYEIYKGKVYDGGIVSFAGKNLGYFSAREMNAVACSDGSPNRGCNDLEEAEIEMKIPYFPNGKYVDFYNPQGEKILTMDLSSVAVCNENNVCEEQKENELNCPSDCKAQSPIMDEVKKEISENSENNIIFLALIILAILIISIGVAFFWLKRRKNYENNES